jgi:hypothetical protein
MEQQYLRVFRRQVRSKSMLSALSELFSYMQATDKEAVTEREVRDFLANLEGGAKLSARFKTHYLLPAPPDPQGSAEPCQ